MSQSDTTPTEEGVLGFLRTDISKEDLATALHVLRVFKDCESHEEWMYIPFQAWGKLEQLEDCLKLLTDTDAGEVDDQRMLEFWKGVRG